MMKHILTKAISINIWIILLAGCFSLASAASEHQTNTLAIMNFTNPDDDAELLEWGRRYAEFLTIELGKDRRLTLVERNKIDEILKELELTLFGLGPKDRAIQIGRLLGAQIMVVGELEKKRGIIQIKVDLVQPSTGNILGEENLRCKEKELFSYQKTLAKCLRKDLNVALAGLKPKEKRNTIAVLQFRNTSQFDRLDPLEVELPEMIMADLKRVGGLLLLERSHIDKIIQEAHLGESGLIEDATAQKALGADILIGGSFCEMPQPGQPMEDSALKIEVVVRKQGVEGPSHKFDVEGEVKEFTQLEKKIIRKVIDVLEVIPKKRDVESLLKEDPRKPESNLFYLRGLETLEKFRELDVRREEYFEQALRAFQKAFYLDSSNSAAKYWIARTYDLAHLKMGGRRRFPPRTEADSKVAYIQEAVREYSEYLEAFPEGARTWEALWSLQEGYRVLSSHYWGLGYYLKTTGAEERAREMLLKRLSILKKIASKWDRIPYIPYHGMSADNAHSNLMYYTARVCIQLEDYAGYIDFYRQYIDRHIKLSYSPHNIQQPILFLAKCYQKMSGVETAIEALEAEGERLSDSRKSCYLVHKTLGWLYSRGSVCRETNPQYTNLEKAITEKEKAVELMPETIMASDRWEAHLLSITRRILLSELLNLSQKAGNWKAMKRSAEEGIRHASLHPREYKDGGRYFYRSKAIACRKLGQYNEAIESYKWLLRAKGPVDVDGLRLCAQKTGRMQELEEFLSKHMKEVPKELPRIAIKGVAYPLGAEYKDSFVNAIVSDGKQVFCGGGNWDRWFTQGNNHSPRFFLLCYDQETRRWSLPSPAEEEIEHPVTALALDGQYVWCATAGSGILRYSRKEDKWKHFTTEDGLFDNEIYSIAVDKDYVWFGGGDLEVENAPDPNDTSSRSRWGLFAAGKGGVSRYDKKAGKWSVYVEAVEEPYAVTALAVDDNRLWIGTAHGSVSVMNKETGVWRNLLPGGKYVITEMVVDDESAWIGSRPIYPTWEVLLRYEKTGEVFKVYSEVKVSGMGGSQGRTPLGKLNVMNVLAFDKKFLYVGSGNRLFVYSKMDNIWWWCSGLTSVLSLGVDEESIWCGAQGRLWEYKKAEILNMLPYP